MLRVSQDADDLGCQHGLQDFDRLLGVPVIGPGHLPLDVFVRARGSVFTSVRNVPCVSDFQLGILAFLQWFLYGTHEGEFGYVGCAEKLHSAPTN